LVEGRLGREAERGREFFERFGCADCHTGPYFTDLKSYKVWHATGQDADREFDTPTLREAWRTAPYLYDGRAATMEEALRIKSKWTPDLDDAEIRALAAYVLSL
jgi:cytochrome c peroxidase